MNWEAFLCVDGVEIANENRVLTYAENLLGGRFVVDICRSAPPGSGYSDFYSDVYEADALTDLLCCPCAAMDADDAPTPPYQSPAFDPAPWYVAAAAASGEFFGLLINRVEVAPISARALTEVATGGAVVGRFRPRPRVVQIDGWLLAGSTRGMRWGERWLTEALGGGCGDDSEVHLIPTCEDSGLPRATPYMTLAHVGLVDGPLFAPVDNNAAEGLIQHVVFTLTAGWPLLLGDPSSAISAEAITGTSAASALVTTEEWDDEAGIVVTVDWNADPISLASGGGLTVEMRPLPSDYDCSDSAPGMACVSFIVGDMPRGERLVIDASRHEVRRFDLSAKAWVPGWDRVALRSPEVGWEWMDVGACARECVYIAGNQVGVEASVSVDVVPVKV